MAAMNKFPADNLREPIDRQTIEQGYDTSGEYGYELIRKVHDRQKMRDLLVAGALSGIGDVADGAYFEALRKRVAERSQP
ncbi:MAG: type II toxin-antitoxin system ParD family antitoxin [Betaproteobacteria bacterium]